MHHRFVQLLCRAWSSGVPTQLCVVASEATSLRGRRKCSTCTEARPSERSRKGQQKVERAVKGQGKAVRGQQKVKERAVKERAVKVKESGAQA